MNMEKITNLPFGRIPIETEAVPDYSKSIPSTDGATEIKYVQNIYYFIPESTVNFFRKLAENQNDIIDKLNLITQSNLGKAMLGLEPFPDQGEKKV